MSELVIHPKTFSALQQYVSAPSHGLLLIGQEGIGKRAIAEWVAVKHPGEVIIIQSAADTTGISIEQIRDLYRVTRTGSALTINVENAHTMGREAQNAFLKLLEEPPAQTRFILTTHRKQALLSTILSRTQHIQIFTPDPAQCVMHAGTLTNLPPTELTSLLTSVGNLPGRYFRLIADSDAIKSHAAKTATAKSFYSGNRYQRHILAVNAKFDRQWALELLDTLALIILTLLHNNTSDSARTAQLTGQAAIVERTTAALSAHNTNVKIQLTLLIEAL